MWRLSQVRGLERPSYVIVGAVPEALVPTGVAAKAIGVDRSTLHGWWQQGKVKPKAVTPGGHARWDVSDLIRQLQPKDED
jgi:hypothetical protein